jgi:hypothetical protein
MKYSYLFVFFLLITTLAIGQNKEKIKGSKNVIEKHIEIGEFTVLQIEDNIAVFLEKGSKNEIKIEADDNLVDNISFDIMEKTLRIYTSKEFTSYKKLVLKIKYTNDLKSVIAKNASIINAIEAVQLDTISFSAIDFAKLYLNVNSKNFKLVCDDKSKIELNLKSEKSKIQMSKNSQIKALIATTDLNLDLYQKATANIEGDATNTVIRQDNNTEFAGFHFTTKNADVTVENNAVCNLMADTSLIIDANGSSEIHLLGTPKIEVRKFLGEAQLIKKAK